jgi:general secretion pathway protein G
MGTTWQWGLWHAGLALVIGVVVFVTSVLASWIHMREPGVGSLHQRQTRIMVASLTGQLHEYHAEHGEWPESICELHEDWCHEGHELGDAWERPFVYSVHDDGVELYSLGRDGRPGGIGLDADLYGDRRNDEAARLPFRQFFHETETRGNRGPCMMIALIAAVQYLSLQIYERPAASAGRRQGILLALGVIVGATIVALLVTPAHIPSGH